MKNTFKFLLLPLAVVCLSTAQAQTAGSWLVRVGATNVTPKVSSGDLTAPTLPGTKVSVGGSTRLSGGITYMVDNNIAVDLPLALPFTSKLSGDGALDGVGKLGDTKVLPITLFGQWHFLESKDKFRPYVGLGLTYAKFYDTRATSTLSAVTGGSPSNPTTMSIQSKWAPTFQVGAKIALDERWFVDAHYAHTQLSNRTTLSTGQTIDVKLNPSIFALALGYRF